MFTLDPSVVDEVSHLAPLGGSDYEVVMWKLSYHNDLSCYESNKLSYNFQRGDY